MSTNEAADRLRCGIDEGIEDDLMHDTMYADLDAALAHERSAGAAPLEIAERLAETEDCLLRECDHDYTADCVDDFRARLAVEETDR